MFRADPQNPRAMELARTLGRLLASTDLPPDLCLVLGGDGMMLRAIHELGSTPTYLGLNCGRVGFLLNDVDSPEEVAARIAARAWRAWSFPRLRFDGRLGEIASGLSNAMDQPPDGTGQVRALAVNDVYVERMTRLSSRLRVDINGITVMEEMMCDGIIISTSLGSTGYSVSAGGPACHPLLSSIHITPICPRSPKLLPIVLPMDAVVEVWPLDLFTRPVRAVADLQSFPGIAHLQVRNACDDVRVAFLDGHDFTATMFRKVLLR